MLDVVAEVDEAVLVVVVPVWVVVVPVLVAAEAELAELGQVGIAVGTLVTPALEQMGLMALMTSVAALAVSCVFYLDGPKTYVPVLPSRRIRPCPQGSTRDRSRRTRLYNHTRGRGL